MGAWAVFLAAGYLPDADRQVATMAIYQTTIGLAFMVMSPVHPSEGARLDVKLVSSAFSCRLPTPPASHPTRTVCEAR